MRRCKKCSIVKDLREFSIRGDTKSKSSRYICKTCCSEKESLRSKTRALYRKNYYGLNKEKLKSKGLIYYKKNKQVIISKMMERLKQDLKFKLKTALRTRLSAAIRNKQKKGSAVRDLGCTIEELKSYLEAKFQPGMTWENRGPMKDGFWQIDHIIPLQAFDLTDRNQLLKAVNYTNLQPLWTKDHYKKEVDMNLKLNLKVLIEMDEDLSNLRNRVTVIKDEAQRTKLIAEIDDKLKCIDTLRAHYQKVYDISQITPKE